MTVKKFAKSFSKYFFFWGIFFIGFAWLLNAYHPIFLISASLLLALAASYQAAKDVNKEIQEQYQSELRQRKEAEKESALWKQSLIEKSAGFLSLFKAIEEYEKLKDEKAEGWLRFKKHPARKAADVVREEARIRREALLEARQARAIIEYYESVAPFLVDLKNDFIDVADEEAFREYDEEERTDPVINYLTKEEYRKLSTAERNQLALDRFWQRPKSKRLIGRIYERYVGYLYERDGYEVDYVGIFKGFEDLGRDLICRKGKDLVIIQCKNWSQFRTIYEKHIFQFFGTVFHYKDSNPDQKVKAIFYTATTLSDLARRFSAELGIELKESFKLDQGYPSIKCNISRIDGTKIYHLPFDQQYDNTKVEINRGEFYCPRVEEAEKAGFRRAFRWRGNREKGA